MTDGTVQFILVVTYLLFWVWVIHAADKPFEEMMLEPKQKPERTEEDGKRKVADMIPQTEILAHLSEELSEAARAALKLRRALDETDPTPKTPEECWEQLEEECGDVMNCLDALLLEDPENRKAFLRKCRKKSRPKFQEWKSRLENANRKGET